LSSARLRLVQTVALEGHREPVVVLTDRGRDLPERIAATSDVRAARPSPRASEGRVSSSAAFQIYSAHVDAAERLCDREARTKRVVLGYELKREYRCFLQEPNPTAAG
jgi:hypothetical protein